MIRDHLRPNLSGPKGEGPVIDTLARLRDAIYAARLDDPAVSRTAKLFAGGRTRISKKVVEEAAEVALDGVTDNRTGVIMESADLLYNLTALWVDMGISPADVWAELERREVVYGIAEKLPKDDAV